MDKVKDIELDSFDLRIKNGDFCVEESDSTHIEQLLLLNKGNLKQSPISGIGAFKYINAPLTANSVENFKQKCKIQLEYDGFVAVKVDMKNDLNNIKIDAKRV
jgi:hypothetical protein